MRAIITSGTIYIHIYIQNVHCTVHINTYIYSIYSTVNIQNSVTKGLALIGDFFIHANNEKVFRKSHVIHLFYIIDSIDMKMKI